MELQTVGFLISLRICSRLTLVIKSKSFALAVVFSSSASSEAMASEVVATAAAMITVLDSKPRVDSASSSTSSSASEELFICTGQVVADENKDEDNASYYEETSELNAPMSEFSLDSGDVKRRRLENSPPTLVSGVASEARLSLTSWVNPIPASIGSNWSLPPGLPRGSAG